MTRTPVRGADTSVSGRAVRGTRGSADGEREAIMAMESEITETKPHSTGAQWWTAAVLSALVAQNAGGGGGLLLLALRVQVVQVVCAGVLRLFLSGNGSHFHVQKAV